MCNIADHALACAKAHEGNINCTQTKATIHQVTTMLATSKHVIFPGHNPLLTTGTDDVTL